MYKEVITIDGQKLTRAYIASLDKGQREALVEPMFLYFRKLGWIYPNLNEEKYRGSYNSLVEYAPDVSVNEIYSNVSMATDLCQYFCREPYYNTTEIKKGKKTRSLKDVFLDDVLLKKVCWNRLGLGWYDCIEERGETFNITPKMVMYQGPRSMRLVPQTTMFKPSVAKLIYMKYSNEGDLVYDCSCGFGNRALGALSCNRKYIGIDPLTTKEVKTMLEFLNIDKNRYTLVNGISEDYIGEKESIDFAFSSPPFYNQESYSDDLSQAYNKGEDYFYNIYWKNTLDNIWNMLKKGKLFGFDITLRHQKMIDMAKDKFGEPVDTFRLRLVRSHLNKSGKEDAQKYEPVYIFRKP